MPSLFSFFRAAGLAAIALASSSAAAQGKPACQYLQLARLPLHYTGPTLDITMDGTINGTPAAMLADTGTGDTILTRTGTEKRGLALRAAAQRIQGVGGMSALYAARVNDFAIGAAKPSSGWMNVIGDTGSAPAFDAIVGATYLLQADMELALADKEIRFFRPVGCDTSWLAYWSRDAVVIPFEINTVTNKPVNPAFTIEVNGAKMVAIIDSGAYRTSIDAHAAQRAGIRTDGPDAVRIGNSSGIGTAAIANWRAHVATIKIGDEVVHDGEVALMDTHGQLGIDVLLGADFLRAHRVLFAMSQRRIYLSHVGGDVFGKPLGIERWVQQEADAGNPDAQLAVALAYRTGDGVPRNAALAASWLDKAAAQGLPRANLVLGRDLLLQGRAADAIAKLKPALDALPAERYGALWLYLARLRTGQEQAGRRELDAAFAHAADDAWPKPLADLFLGHIDAAALQAAARRDEQRAAIQACQANEYGAELQAARAGTAAPAPLQCDPKHP
jgi:predicted aspartyl protease